MITHPAKIEEAGDNSISFIAHPKYHQFAYSSHAAAIIVHQEAEFEHPVKAALIRALPDKVIARLPFSCVGCRRTIEWRHENYPVTPHEWPAIVGMVEDKLNEADKEKYVHHLHKGSNKINVAAWHCAFAKWMQRAQAIADIGAIKVCDPCDTTTIIGGKEFQ